MKKPALIETTVRLSPDKEFEAATTPTTIKGHATGSLYYSPLKDRKNLLRPFLKKGLAPYASCNERLEKTLENGKNGYIVTRGARVWRFNKSTYLHIFRTG
jgi:hypothetical protein